MRLGATFRPQCQDGYFKNGASCALGAVAEAIAPNSEGSPDWMLSNRFPELRDVDSIVHPFSKVKRFSLWETIVDLNDEHEWTRERIADWLASIGH